MKITQIQAVRLELPDRRPAPPATRPHWTERTEVANPMSRYPHVKARRSQWMPAWGELYCKVTAEDGTWGLGVSRYDRPIAAIIDEHFAPQLVGQPALATERLHDMMARLSRPYGTAGLAAYAISAVDLALWDLKGKLLGQPVYALLGGPARDDMFCYATGNDPDWYVELGFEAFKLACLYGPADGLRGLEANDEHVARTRELIGSGSELMLDCWMAFDVEYTVRLAERLRPHGLRWIEDCASPEDLDAHAAIRQRLPWQTLAAGEHWYMPETFGNVLARRMVDILQPDIAWAGGITACQKIVHMAEAANVTTILHAGANTPYGQHFTYSMPSMPWIEAYVDAAPGQQLDWGRQLPGTPTPKNGRLRPSDAPGFGIEVDESWLVPVG